MNCACHKQPCVYVNAEHEFKNRKDNLHYNSVCLYMPQVQFIVPVANTICVRQR